MNDSYEINQKDIDSTLNFLRIYDQKNATPENAVLFLEYLQSGVHNMARDNPEKLEKIYEQFLKRE
ncbi:hypothetical protein A2707_00065 [Candidatus Saccharibacteria bacterium RIFCSPHIGHO2_01_FULL_45_15]|jgi:hypothetical protein|nr:MAG: hypothetical protein A2707_00065 [Candidatus Saccharibacteria bacterium RIFCSPHIGHO2_01_FULL_45_15]OGL28514.1 MAG: hypothetical protein A3C39_03625 [Candidatus Saccharibacteria bacterium RIFCSPHIGHO2_02_FULL_46_12]OGL32368.1 MAG: hypothetical protein A3E76_04450 [Candidatus Saccharibacteria bacterium RIFCSPHIGHO2_12_FULL_44_22]